MKKCIAAVFALAALLAAGPVHAGHEARTVEGSVLVPAVTVPTVGTFTRQARCAYDLLGEDSQGLVGYVVELDESEADGEHEFTLAATGDGDFQVVFYESLGTCDNDPAPVVTGQFTAPGDEAGPIPEFSAYAIIVVEGAVDAGFEFSVL